MRLAVQRAADKAHRLAITVESLLEESLTLDQLETLVAEDYLLVGLTHDVDLVGLAALDQQLRSALIEMQTMGRLQAASAEPRPATATDALMMTDLLAMLLKMLGETTQRTELDGWASDVQVGTRVPSLRAAALALSDVDYRVIRLVINLGVADRQGEMTLLLPMGQELIIDDVIPAASETWQPNFQKTVAAASATLNAELHRFTVPLYMAEGITVGQIMPLHGCTVDSVRMLDPDGNLVSAARLGQFAGKRAVRLEPNPYLGMTEVSVKSGEQSQMSQPVQLPQDDIISPDQDTADHTV